MSIALETARPTSLYPSDVLEPEWVVIETMTGRNLSQLHHSIYLRHPWLSEVHPDHVRLDIRVSHSSGVRVSVHRDHIPAEQLASLS
jgi:hypothetical protein